MGGPRSNLTYHPPEIRRRVYQLHYEGRTGAEIVADPEVAESIRRTGYRLHGNTLTAAWRSDDYQEYRRRREETEQRIGNARWAAEALRDTAGIGSVADMTQMALLEQLRELAEKGSGNPAELLKLATAVTRIKAADSDERNARLSRQLEELKRLREAAEAEHRSREAELEAKLAEKEKQLAELAAELSKFKALNSGAVIEEMDKFVKGE